MYKIGVDVIVFYTFYTEFNIVFFLDILKFISLRIIQYLHIRFLLAHAGI